MISTGYMRTILISCLLYLIAIPVSAQSDYAGQQHRPIKALSEAEIQGYLNGAGMGYARAAELNHYPGPMHVLELADSLALSPDQLARTQALFDAVKDEARRLGREVVAKERELDRLFADAQADDANVRALLEEIALLQARLRGAHLRAHIAQRDVLSAGQIARYDELRGYTSGNGVHGHQ